MWACPQGAWWAEIEFTKEGENDLLTRRDVVHHTAPTRRSQGAWLETHLAAARRLYTAENR